MDFLNPIAKPFGLLLMWLYEFFGNYGLAVIVFALLVKLVLLPFQMKSKRGMMQTSRLQPRLKELEKKHGANKAKYNEEVAKLYKEEKISPMSGCIWSLIPFPILIALYQAIRQPLTIMMGVASDLLNEGGAISNMLSQLGFSTTVNDAYIQISQAQFITNHFDQFASLSDKLRQINYSFLSLDLGKQPQWNFLWSSDFGGNDTWLQGFGLFVIPLISGVLAFLASKVSTKMNPAADAGPQGGSMKSMMLMMPLISIYIAYIMPAALGIYWIASTFFGIIQDIWLTKRYKKIMDAEGAVRLERQRAKEAELESKRKETERLKAENSTKANPNTSKRKQAKTERQQQAEKAAQWEKAQKKDAQDDESGGVGSRRFARGRAYDQNRFCGESQVCSDPSSAEDLSESPPPEKTIPAVADETDLTDGFEEEAYEEYDDADDTPDDEDDEDSDKEES